MHNLGKFFKKFFSLFFFLFLQAICAWLIYNNNQFHQTSMINSANKVSGNVFLIFDNLGSYLSLKSTNDSLAAQNARLMEQSQIKYAIALNDSVQVTDTIYYHQYTYTSAKVLNNTVHRPSNFLTINKGTNHGLEKGMGVVGANGIVGIIKDVSSNFSTVMSILNRQSKISVRLKTQQNIGSLVWNNLDPASASLADIPKHVQLSKSDQVITSGFSSIFPEGILVGKLNSFDIPAGNNFYSIELHLAEDFTKLQHVYVIKNLTKTEQLKLEEQTENEQ